MGTYFTACCALRRTPTMRSIDITSSRVTSRPTSMVPPAVMALKTHQPPVGRQPLHLLGAEAELRLMSGSTLTSTPTLVAQSSPGIGTTATPAARARGATPCGGTPAPPLRSASGVDGTTSHSATPSWYQASCARSTMPSASAI